MLYLEACPWIRDQGGRATLEMLVKLQLVQLKGGCWGGMV